MVSSPTSAPDGVRLFFPCSSWEVFFSRSNHGSVEARGMFATDLSSTSLASYFFCFSPSSEGSRVNGKQIPLAHSKEQKLEAHVSRSQRGTHGTAPFEEFASSVPPNEGMANSFETDPPSHTPIAVPNLPFHLSSLLSPDWSLRAARLQFMSPKWLALLESSLLESKHIRRSWHSSSTAGFAGS